MVNRVASQWSCYKKHYSLKSSIPVTIYFGYKFILLEDIYNYVKDDITRPGLNYM
jgi:hypothetical protein